MKKNSGILIGILVVLVLVLIGELGFLFKDRLATILPAKDPAPVADSTTASTTQATTQATTQPTTEATTEPTTEATTEPTAPTTPEERAEATVSAFAAQNGLTLADYPESLMKLLARNPETEDFVLSYPLEKDMEHTVDLSGTDLSKVPLFLQWDKRWGYTIYGNDVAGLTACGPTALSMAAYYLTGGDPKMTPDKIIQFALDNGYCAPGNGSYWSLIYQGGEDLGLDVWEIDKGYASVKEEVEGGHVIICLVGPGAFTTDGHFIVIAGMDSDGKLIINDSNSRTRSEKTWDYYEIYDQIDTMWTLCGHDYVG